MRWLPKLVVATPVLAFALACGSSGSGSDSGAETVGDCLDVADPADADQARLVVAETGESYHEMVACGGLAFRLSRSLIEIFATSFLDAQGVRVPNGFVYDGEGHYVSGDDDTTMSISYLYGDDYPGIAEGDLIVENLFEIENYVRTSSVDVDPVTGDVLIHWDSTGPLVALLGRGSSPGNPMRFDAEDLRLPYRLGRSKMVADVEVIDARDASTVSYLLRSSPRRISPMLDGDEMDFQLQSSTTTGSDGSTLTASSIGVDYNDEPATLDGTVDFQLRGGALDLDGTFVFADSAYADTTLICP